MSFADKGIKQSGRTKDGKKFFDVQATRLMDILNVPITVVDFETNVKTKQGEGRYCVLCEQNGQRSKFITNCYNLKDVLDQALSLIHILTTGYTIELYQVNSISSQTMLTTANHEIVALSLTSLIMDLRLVEKLSLIHISKPVKPSAKPLAPKIAPAKKPISPAAVSLWVRERKS